MRPHFPPIRGIATTFLLGVMLSCNVAPKTQAAPANEPAEGFSYRDLDPRVWSDSPANRATDPYQVMLQTLRDRKARDLASPDAPSAFGPKDGVAKEFRAPGAPWDELEEAISLDWESIGRASPVELLALRGATRFRTVLRHPDLRIIEVAMAPGARLPSHALADPSMFHIVGGSAELTVADQVIEASVGASIKVEPLAVRSIRVTSDEPLRALWFRWAPDGDATYLSFGYYLTGANFHLQPLEATLPDNYEHWADAMRRPSSVRPSISEIESEAGASPFLRAQRAAHRQAVGSTRAPSYPTTPVLANELDANWLDFTKLADAGFFWAKDAQAGGDILVRWNEIARMKGVFRASRPDGPYDFNLSYIATGPTGKYVTHSHATPEFYYILEGETEWIVGAETFTARAGHTYFHSPYSDHEMRGLVEGKPMRAITGSWAPFGDRSVWTKPGFLLEPLPTQPPEATMAEAFDFHQFETKKLEFEAR